MKNQQIQYAKRLAREEIAVLSRMVRTQKKVKQRVRQLLKEFPEARNADAVLFWLYAKKYLSLIMPAVESTVLRALSFDSVCRARRHLQNVEGLFLPTDPKVLRFRKLMSKAMVEAYGTGTSTG